MKLDIGCGEFKIEEDYIGVDYDSYLDSGNVNLNPDIIADARWLPFKDDAFKDVFSGACIGLYVGEDAFDEALRVLVPGGRIRIRIFTTRLGKVLQWMFREDLLITDLEPINYAQESFIVEGGSDIMIIEDVMITARKR